MELEARGGGKIDKGKGSVKAVKPSSFTTAGCLLDFWEVVDSNLDSNSCCNLGLSFGWFLGLNFYLKIDPNFGLILGLILDLNFGSNRDLDSNSKIDCRSID